jgi:hypothetical protein
MLCDASIWDWIFRFRWWIGAAVLAVAVLFVAFLLLVFVVALFEKARLRRLIAVDPQRHSELPDKSKEVISTATSTGFRPLGLYSDGDKGWRESLIALFLPEDGQTLLWVQSRPRRHKLITQFEDGRWLISTDIKGAADISGTHDEQMLPDVPLGVLLDFHLERVASQASARIRPFSPRTLIEDLNKHERDRVARLIDQRLARYRSAEEDAWSYTLAGALKLSAASGAAMTETKRQMDLAKERAEGMRRFPAGQNESDPTKEAM